MKQVKKAAIPLELTGLGTGEGDSKTGGSGGTVPRFTAASGGNFRGSIPER